MLAFLLGLIVAEIIDDLTKRKTVKAAMSESLEKLARELADEIVLKYGRATCPQTDPQSKWDHHVKCIAKLILVSPLLTQVQAEARLELQRDAEDLRFLVNEICYCELSGMWPTAELLNRSRKAKERFTALDQAAHPVPKGQ